mgnify:CR=1 FL=1
MALGPCSWRAISKAKKTATGNSGGFFVAVKLANAGLATVYSNALATYIAAGWQAELCDKLADIAVAVADAL